MALFRLAESIQKEEGRYPALEAVLKRERPRIQGLSAGGPSPHDRSRRNEIPCPGARLELSFHPGASRSW